MPASRSFDRFKFTDRSFTGDLEGHTGATGSRPLPERERRGFAGVDDDGAAPKVTDFRSPFCVNLGHAADD